MTADASSARTHCLSPAQDHAAVQAAGGPSRYSRMFPELTAFEPDVTFLHAIGRAGGQSARGEVVVDPGRSLALAEHALERLVR